MVDRVDFLHTASTAFVGRYEKLVVYCERVHHQDHSGSCEREEEKATEIVHRSSFLLRRLTFRLSSSNSSGRAPS